MRKMLDMAGKMAGDLEFIRPAGRSPKGAVLWECLCHRCGQKCVVEAQRINDPRGPKDCGCRRREKLADLSGQTFGALYVIKRTGSTKGGDRVYLCRCTICGREKEFPACTIRSLPKGCGCLQYDPAAMAAYSQLGTAAQFKDVGGAQKANLPAAYTDKAKSTSKTGVRGVFPEPNRPGRYRFAVSVAGERIIKTGFTSVAAAKSALDEVKSKLLKKYGLDKQKSP